MDSKGMSQKVKDRPVVLKKIILWLQAEVKVGSPYCPILKIHLYSSVSMYVCIC